MISATSVKDRLKNQAASGGKTFQEALIAYGLERTVYRLSVSEYMERFTLKGGIFLYALFEGQFARATSDIDLLAGNMPNDSEDMKNVFENIFSIECDDALRYDLDTLDVVDITEFNVYRKSRKKRSGFGNERLVLLQKFSHVPILEIEVFFSAQIDSVTTE